MDHFVIQSFLSVHFCDARLREKVNGEAPWKLSINKRSPLEGFLRLPAPLATTHDSISLKN
jgi:hypothetical protein